MKDPMYKLFPEVPVISSDRITLRALADADADDLYAFAHNEEVYRYLPTFLFEQKYDDIHYVIAHLYDECLEESLILGVFENASGRFAGLSEFYGYKEAVDLVSIGCRLLPDFWGKGITTEVVRLMVEYLQTQTKVATIQASTMMENTAAGRTVQKNGFTLVASNSPEDWGYPDPTPSNKWIR